MKTSTPPEWQKIYNQRLRDLELLKNEIEYFIDNPNNENIDILNNSITNYYEEWVSKK